MPRVGDNYVLPPDTAAVDGVTASAADVNARFNDLAADANAVRPVSKGGTGVSTLAALFAPLGLKGLAKKDTVGAADIDADAVTTAKVADDAITSAKLAATPGAVTDQVLRSDETGALSFGRLQLVPVQQDIYSTGTAIVYANGTTDELWEVITDGTGTGSIFRTLAGTAETKIATVSNDGPVTVLLAPGASLRFAYTTPENLILVRYRVRAR